MKTCYDPNDSSIHGEDYPGERLPNESEGVE